MLSVSTSKISCYWSTM